MTDAAGALARCIACRFESPAATVYECRQAVKIPILGMGGIASARDALEFIIAGATAVQIGTANFVDPFIWSKLLEGIGDYMARQQVATVADLVGTVDTRARDKEWISS